MYQQVAMQLLRGLQAVKDALGPYDYNGQYLKERSTSEPGVVRPEDFGAKGDGVTDDTAAMQRAVNFAAGLGTAECPICGGVVQCTECGLFANKPPEKSATEPGGAR
jgi:hypothetical protein